MYNKNLKEDDLSTRVSLYENLKPKTSIPLPPDPDLFVKEQELVHLEYYVWPNPLKATLPSLISEF